MRTPPHLADWLLTRFVANDALAGDLTEEFAQTQSNLWYWRQTVLAIAVGAFADVRNDKPMTANAALVGCCFLIWFSFVGNTVFGAWYPSFPLYHLTGCTGYFLGGWIVSHYFRFSRFICALLLPLMIASALRWAEVMPAWVPRTLQPFGWKGALALSMLFLGGVVGSLALKRPVARAGGSVRPDIGRSPIV